MIVRIARKELTEQLRDGRFRASAAIIAVLLIGATAVGWRSWRDVSEEHTRAQAEAREHFECQEEKNPHAAAHYGLYLFKPKLPLAFVDPGIDPYTGVSVYLEAHQRNDLQHRPARDATALQRFGELTAAAVLQFLMPLLIVVLTFPSIAAEREQGTLRQVLSLGVQPGQLVAGKALGLAVSLGLIAVPAVAIGVYLLIQSGPDAEKTWPHALAMATGYLVYLGIFLLLSLTVSARARSSRAALITLLAFWIVNTMIAPRLATDLSRRWLPTPSSLEFHAAIDRDIRQGIDGHDPADERLRRLEEDLLTQYDVDFVEDLPVNFQGIALQASEEYGNAVFDRHHDTLWERFWLQNALRKGLGFVLPTLAIRELSMGLAGTDTSQYHEFSEAAETHRRIIVRTLNKDLEINGADLGFMYQAGPELWESMPLFRYEMPEIGSVLFRQAFACLALIFWLALSIELLNRSARSLRAD
ncbi:DUF3526 domain-containing protein [Tautonia rosea]|uniref:DUF3526 domain-containing protein n=1 Tax=Tautonia rosea TaxID=2728037 RepID=UPI0014747B80|nr:DUF3526 domain-containing protein [Tautonia rosea]